MTRHTEEYPFEVSVDEMECFALQDLISNRLEFLRGTLDDTDPEVQALESFYSKIS